MPGYVLKKGGGGKREVVCRLVRLQEENTGIKDPHPGEQKREKREVEIGGKVMKKKREKAGMEKEYGAGEIELLDFSDTNAHGNTDHDIGVEDGDECENSISPGCNLAAVMAILGGDSSVWKSDVDKNTRSPSPHNFQQNVGEEDIDLGEIRDISGGEERTGTIEGNSQKKLPSNPVVILEETSSWSPLVAISAVFLISMAAFVIVASLLIRRLDIATTSKQVKISRT